MLLFIRVTGAELRFQKCLAVRRVLINQLSQPKQAAKPAHDYVAARGFVNAP